MTQKIVTRRFQEIWSEFTLQMLLTWNLLLFEKWKLFNPKENGLMTRPFRSYPVQYSIFKGTHFSISHPIHLLFSQAVFSISMQMFLATTMEKALNFLNGFQTRSQKNIQVAIKDHLEQIFLHWNVTLSTNCRKFFIWQQQ